MWKVNMEQDWGLNRHTVAAIGQPTFAHNKGTQVQWRGEVNIKKIHWGVILSA